MRWTLGDICRRGARRRTSTTTPLKSLSHIAWASHAPPGLPVGISVPGLSDFGTANGCGLAGSGGRTVLSSHVVSFCSSELAPVVSQLSFP